MLDTDGICGRQEERPVVHDNSQVHSLSMTLELRAITE